MRTSEINNYLSEAARVIREQTAAMQDLWQTVPYLSLEQDGRGGWNRVLSFSYKYGLHITSRVWPPEVYIECATGQIVSQQGDMVIGASDKSVIMAYLLQPAGFDARQVVGQLRNELSRELLPSWNSEPGNTLREQLRTRYGITERHTKPAQAPSWGY